MQIDHVLTEADKNVNATKYSQIEINRVIWYQLKSIQTNYNVQTRSLCWL